MASEVISHAIFASSHPTPPRTAPSYTPPSTPRFALHLALHSHPTPHHALHPAPRPTFPSLSLSQAPPSKSLHLPPVHPFPIRVSPSLSVPQPSPFTPYFTPHPIMPCALTPIPHHPFPSHFFAPQDSFSQVPPSTSLHLSPVHQFPIRVSPPSVSFSQAPLPRTSPRIPSCPSPCAPTPFPTTHFPSASLHPSLFLSQVPPVDFLVRKKARFTHDMTFFHHDVRGKRFNAHEGSHKMEMIISKDHVAEKPRRGWDLWRHGRP